MEAQDVILPSLMLAIYAAYVAWAGVSHARFCSAHGIARPNPGLRRVAFISGAFMLFPIAPWAFHAASVVHATHSRAGAQAPASIRIEPWALSTMALIVAALPILFVRLTDPLDMTVARTVRDAGLGTIGILLAAAAWGRARTLRAFVPRPPPSAVA